MAYTAQQLIAVSGFLQNTGIGVSDSLLTALGSAQSITTLSGKLRRVANHPSASAAVILSLRTNLPGLSLTAPISITSAHVGVSLLDPTDSVRGRATLLFARGVSGFLTALSQSSSACQASRNILGAVYSFETGSFQSIGPNIKTHSDLVTAGITGRFGPLAANTQDNLRASTLYSGNSPLDSSPATIKTSITAIADGILKLGSLYDWGDLENFGTPLGLTKSLLKQGLINIEIRNLFAQQGIDLNYVEDANKAILGQVLSQITGTNLEKIIYGTNLQLSSGTVINTAADLLEADKVLPSRAVSAIPYGTLYSLAQQLIGLNVISTDPTAIATALKNVIIPDHPTLQNQIHPLEVADGNIIKAYLPTGSGEFDSPLIQEMIGTPSGYIFTDALSEIALIQTTIASSSQYIALAAAADALYAIYTAGTSATTAEATLVSAVSALASVSDYQDNLALANTQITKIITQLTLEITNCELAGIDVYSYSPGSISTVLALLSFPTIGTDPYNSGVRKLLYSMLTNDKYGEAVQAVLLQGQNDNALKSIGVSTVGIPDIPKLSKELSAQSGKGLTIQQQQNVIEYARRNGLDQNSALANAAFYGYDNQFYVSRGFESA